MLPTIGSTEMLRGPTETHQPPKLSTPASKTERLTMSPRAATVVSEERWDAKAANDYDMDRIWNHHYSMISARDSRIHVLESDRSRLHSELAVLRSELASLRSKHETETSRLKTQVRERSEQNRVLKERLGSLGKELENKAIHEYASAIREASPTAMSSSYVVTLQSQLAKKTHQREVYAEQLTMLNHSSQAILQRFKEDLDETVKSKCEMEETYKKKLIEANAKNVKLQEKFEAQVGTLTRNYEESLGQTLGAPAPGTGTRRSSSILGQLNMDRLSSLLGGGGAGEKGAAVSAEPILAKGMTGGEEKGGGSSSTVANSRVPIATKCA